MFAAAHHHRLAVHPSNVCVKSNHDFTLPKKQRQMSNNYSATVFPSCVFQKIC
jgi:hypothetical protein